MANGFTAATDPVTEFRARNPNRTKIPDILPGVDIAQTLQGVPPAVGAWGRRDILPQFREAGRQFQSPTLTTNWTMPAPDLTTISARGGGVNPARGPAVGVPLGATTKKTPGVATAPTGATTPFTPGANTPSTATAFNQTQPNTSMSPLAPGFQTLQEIPGQAALNTARATIDPYAEVGRMAGQLAASERTGRDIATRFTNQRGRSGGAAAAETPSSVGTTLAGAGGASPTGRSIGVQRPPGTMVYRGPRTRPVWSPSAAGGGGAGGNFIDYSTMHPAEAQLLWHLNRGEDMNEKVLATALSSLAQVRSAQAGVPAQEMSARAHQTQAETARLQAETEARLAPEKIEAARFGQLYGGLPEGSPLRNQIGLAQARKRGYLPPLSATPEPLNEAGWLGQQPDMLGPAKLLDQDIPLDQLLNQFKTIPGIENPQHPARIALQHKVRGRYATPEAQQALRAQLPSSQGLDLGDWLGSGAKYDRTMMLLDFFGLNPAEIGLERRP